MAKSKTVNNIHIGQERFLQNWRNGDGGKILLSILVLFKIVSTFVSFLSHALHNIAVAFSAWCIPFAFAAMYNDEIALKFGVQIIILVCIGLIVWIASPLLILIRNETISRVGVICVIVVNLCDLLCCLLSFTGIEHFIKAINIVFSAVLVLISFLLLRKMAV